VRVARLFAPSAVVRRLGFVTFGSGAGHQGDGGRGARVSVGHEVDAFLDNGADIAAGDWKGLRRGPEESLDIQLDLLVVGVGLEYGKIDEGIIADFPHGESAFH